MTVQKCRACHTSKPDMFLHASGDFMCPRCAAHKDDCLERGIMSNFEALITSVDQQDTTTAQVAPFQPTAPVLDGIDTDPVPQDLLERLIATMDNAAFVNVFRNNLCQIYTYDQAEIINCLCNMSQAKEMLMELRLSLYEDAISLLPEYSTTEMFNRRKTSLLAEDVFIFSYCIINKSRDIRLSKLMKNSPDPVTNPKPSGSAVHEAHRRTKCT